MQLAGSFTLYLTHSRLANQTSTEESLVMLIAVNYHYVRSSFDNPYPGIHGITPTQLEGQLKLLGTVGTFVSARDIQAAIRGATPLPEKSIAVTFDDGLREQYEIAWPVLRRLGIPAIFFINTGPIACGTLSTVHKIHLLRSSMAPGDFLHLLRRKAREIGLALDVEVDSLRARMQYKYDDQEIAALKYLLNFVLPPDRKDNVIEACFCEAFPKCEAKMSQDLYMSVSQIKELGSHGCIGTHGHEHVPLGVLPVNVAEEQIQVSATYLERWTGVRPVGLSYPYGSLEATSLAVADRAAKWGIEFAFTMERAANGDLTRPLFLARFSSNDLPGGQVSEWTADALFEAVPASSWYRS